MARNGPLSLFFLTFIISILTLPNVTSSLSTVAISYTSNFTLVCALIPKNRQSYINCSTFPSTAANPISSNTSFSALIGGRNFLCALRSQSSSDDALSCWRFTQNGTILTYRNNGSAMTTDKRIYTGPALADLQSGTSHFCGLVGETRRLQCWQWAEFNQSDFRTFSSFAVGGEFVCRLSRVGKIECLGSDSRVVDSQPTVGNFTTVAAGSRHACAIRDNGGVECWGETGGIAPSGVFESLALGENRSCAILTDGTAVCWGKANFRLPDYLNSTQFIEIEAKDRVFCGILVNNYSLICWGSDNFVSDNNNHMVFERVLPGPCIRACPCGFLPGYSDFCASGYICERCGVRPTPPNVTETPPRSSGGSTGGKRKGRVAFLVVGSVGLFVGVAAAISFIIFKYCSTQTHSSRVHDSGRLDEEATPTQQPMSPNSRRMARLESMKPHLEKRLSHLLSSGPAGNLEEFPLDELLRITDNFSQENKIGSGSFGSVYRATLDDGREVAIKRAELAVSTSSHAAGIGTKRREKEYAFLSELGLLSRLNHKNLVQLIGYSDEANERMLVYDYMANGTLHDHLHKLRSSPLMSWVTRLKVALDAARGVEYLHSYAVPPIIHRDIKSSNILLDDTWTAKVADFGLSLMGPGPYDDVSHLSLRVAGTMGYMDPEYYRLQQLTTKSDVYSFGVLLLELLTGYKAIHRGEDNGPPRNIVDFAVPYIISDEIHHILDPKLPPPTPNEIEAVVYVGYRAADCVSLEGRDRPSMSEIVNFLERALAACLIQPSLSRSTTRSST